MVGTLQIESIDIKLDVNLYQIVMYVSTKLEAEHPRDNNADSDRASDEDNDRQFMTAQTHFGSESKTKQYVFIW